MKKALLAWLIIAFNNAFNTARTISPTKISTSYSSTCLQDMVDPGVLLANIYLYW